MSQYTFKLHSPEEIQEWPDPEWLIKDILPLNGFSEIVGRWGGGKTFVVLDWGLSIAAGIPWGGKHPVRQGSVLYVFGEGRSGLKQRINAWFKHYHVDPAGVPFYAIDLPLQLASMDQLNKFTEDVDAQLGQDEDLQLIIFDTLSRSIVGVDENRAEQMGIVVGSLEGLRRGYNASVLTVHHTGHKNPKRGRGWSGVPAALDASIVTEKNADSRIVKISCNKMKDGDEFEDMAVTLVDSAQKRKDGKAATLVSELGGRVPVADPVELLGRSQNAKKLLKFLVVERPMGDTYQNLRDQKIVKDGSFHASLTRLTELGFVRQDGPHYSPTDAASEVVDLQGFN